MCICMIFFLSSVYVISDANVQNKVFLSFCLSFYLLSHFREYSVPASGYDWIDFGILETPAIDIALQVGFNPLRL